MYWEKYSKERIKSRVFEALSQNVNYRKSVPLGFPGSFLDPEVYNENAPFLNDAPFLTTLMSNPNHIGCHTMGQSEGVYQGTQALEREVIDLCATEIFKSIKGEIDGYVASGGTEANIEAFWIARNYFISKHKARLEEIALVYSEDSHYSMPKGANLLGLKSVVVPVDEQTRGVMLDAFKSKIETASKNGVKHFLVVMNMSTTMFGSVDPIGLVGQVLDSLKVEYYFHIDGAYGGFIYPFSANDNLYSFENERVLSVSFDAHKLLLAPYGTGLFLVRAGFMSYALTEEANYVQGKDYTLVGSRSGANAVAVWMILRTYGSEGWRNKVNQLVERTDWFCAELDNRGIQYFRQPFINIVAIKAGQINADMLKKYFLVPDNHDDPKWWKIVIMDHVEKNKLVEFLSECDRFEP